MTLPEQFKKETGCLLKTHNGYYTDEYVEWLEELNVELKQRQRVISLSTFKKHIARFADKESFKTYCGITEENCSEDFWESDTVVQIKDEKNATCKRCLMQRERQKDYLRSNAYFNMPI